MLPARGPQLCRLSGCPSTEPNWCLLGWELLLPFSPVGADEGAQPRPCLGPPKAGSVLFDPSNSRDRTAVSLRYLSSVPLTLPRDPQHCWSAALC